MLLWYAQHRAVVDVVPLPEEEHDTVARAEEADQEQAAKERVVSERKLVHRTALPLRRRHQHGRH